MALQLPVVAVMLLLTLGAGRSLPLKTTTVSLPQHLRRRAFTVLAGTARDGHGHCAVCAALVGGAGAFRC